MKKQITLILLAALLASTACGELKENSSGGLLMTSL